MVGLPVEAVGVEALRSVEAEVVHLLVVALTVGVVVELHLSGILTENFDIYLVPRVAVGLARVGEERGNYALVLDSLHRGLIVTVVVEVVCSVFSACVVILA